MIHVFSKSTSLLKF